MTERKTLQLRDPSEGADAAPVLKKKGRGWEISEKRLDAIHERALLGRVPGNLVTELGARLNSLVGPPEEPVKHEIDEEAADVGVTFVDGKAGAGIGWGEACKAREGYVLPPAL